MQSNVETSLGAFHNDNEDIYSLVFYFHVFNEVVWNGLYRICRMRKASS